jgi:hypothetical protein
LVFCTRAGTCGQAGGESCWGPPWPLSGRASPGRESLPHCATGVKGAAGACMASRARGVDSRARG